MGTLTRGSDSGTFEFIIPNNDQQEQPVASSSKAPAEEEEKELVYSLRENEIPAKSSKWMYYEDERRHRYSGRTTERGEGLGQTYMRKDKG